MDFSFLKLYNSISESLSDDKFRNSQTTYFTSIQLHPKETYLQMTNYEGGLSFSGNYECYIIDPCGTRLSDITNHVFIEEFDDVDGNTQNKIEIVNIGQDYYGRAVQLEFLATDSNISYYTRPIKISSKDINRTYRFDYKNNSNLPGLSYVNANVYQSIRLCVDFQAFSNDSEVSDYYQISVGNIISTRPLRKLSRTYNIENIDTFTFTRLQEVLFHDVIYIEGERITDKPILEVGDRIGRTNLLKSSFTAFIDDSDTYEYEFQVFDGLILQSKIPLDSYTLDSYPDLLRGVFNIEVKLNTGTIKVFDASDDSVLATYTESDIVLSNDNTIDVASFTGLINANGSYYIQISNGIVTGLSIDYKGIQNKTDWAFTIQDGDYSSADYSSDYLTD